MSRVDGIHFPTGQDMSTGLFDVLDPTSTTILNEPEARWHYADVRARLPQASVIWRASPDKKPADVGWDAEAYSRHIFEGLDFHADRHNQQYPLDILLLNELNLDYERGENHHDGGAWDTNPENWPGLYLKIATFLKDLHEACWWKAQTRGVSPHFWFPAWAPGHGEQQPEILSIWKPGAEQFSGVCLHSYGSVETITRDVQWYAEQFPDMPLLLGEWNTDGFAGDRIAEEIRIRARLRALGRRYPQLRACYFIWAWEQDASRKSYDIEGNPDREAVWDGIETIPYDPWGDPAPEPIPEPEPLPEPLPPPPIGDVPVPQSLPRGIDVASYQGHPDWAAVRSDGIEFAFSKATEGTEYVNPTFAYNWQRMLWEKIYRGTYHFARPDQSLPEDEAEFFWAAVRAQGIEPGDVFALDLEDLNGSLTSAPIVGYYGVSRSEAVRGWTLRFLRRLTTLIDCKPMLYVNPGVIQQFRFDLEPDFGQYGLWLAKWQDGFPSPPAPWDVVAVWQKGAHARVVGIDGEVDEDYFNGPIESFARYGVGASPVPGPEPEPAPEPPVPPPPPPGPTLEQEIAALRTVLSYATHEIPDALDREIAAMEASLGALKAARDELRRQG